MVQEKFFIAIGFIMSVFCLLTGSSFSWHRSLRRTLQQHYINEQCMEGTRVPFALPRVNCATEVK